MQFLEILERVRKIKQAYNVANRMEGYKTWTANEYLQGFVGDVGDLAKLILAKKGFVFDPKDTDKKIAKEMADLLWSVLVLADELEVDLETEFVKTLEKLEDKIKDRKVTKRAVRSV